jgi:hypothetical protein
MIHLCTTSPLRPLNWRWQKAQALRESGRAPSRSRDDEWVRLARRFQVELMTVRDDWQMLALAERYPSLVEAREVHTNDGLRGARWELEARLLSKDENIANVCRRLCLTPGGVRAYEALYFNVADRLDNTGWVVHSVIGPLVHAGLSERQYEILWKLYGFFYGPVFLDCLIDTVVPTSRPASVDKVPAAIQDDFRNVLRRKALVAIRTMPVNSFTQPMILEIETKYQEMEKALSGAAGGTQILVDTIGDLMGSMRNRWTVGDGTEDRPVAKRLMLADGSAAEYRAGELMMIASGSEPGLDDETVGLTFPEANHDG